MYKKGTLGWIRHIDFMLLDILCLNISALAVLIVSRHFFGVSVGGDFYNFILPLNITAIGVAIVSKAYSGILRRGYYREMVSALAYTLLIFLVEVFYHYVIEAQLTEELRNGLLLTLGIFFLLSYFVRVGYKPVARAHSRKNKDRSMLVVTIRDNAEEVVRALTSDGYEEFGVSGLVIADEDMTGKTIGGVPVVAGVDNAADYICRRWVDEVFVDLNRDTEYPEKLIAQLKTMGLTIHLRIAGLNQIEENHQLVETLGGYAVLTSSLNYALSWQLFVKRFFDIIGGAVGCALTGVLFIFIAPILKIKSPGPIFFKQIRVGKNGKKFQLYKFRTMYTDAEERKKDLMSENRVKDGMMFKLDCDERIIGCKRAPDGKVKKGFGGWLRTLSIDECPQFFNVLKGDMSLVGTRPPTLDEWEKYELHHRARLAIKPGLTGMWQVSGRSSITDFEEVVRLDTKYIREWRIILDIKILFKTIVSVFKREGSM